MRKNSEVRVLTIEEVIKATQPEVYSKLNKRYKHTKKKKEEKLTKRCLEELMSHPSYRRGSGGSIRQVK